MGSIPQDIYDPFELFMLIYIVVIYLVEVYRLFRYIAMGFSCFRMMNKLGMRKTWMAWVPFCNIYALGDLADNYNLLCEGKATYYAKKLLAWNIVTTVLSCRLFILLLAHSPDVETPLTYWLQLLGHLALFIVYQVFYYITLYKIYRLFTANSAVKLLILSILVPVSVPVIFLILSGKHPRLPFDQDNGDPPCVSMDAGQPYYEM